MNRRTLVTVAIVAAACFASGLPALAAEPSFEASAGARLGLQHHGEAVFRLQNAVMDELMDAQALDTNQSPDIVASLESAEDRMSGSCRDLNEAASLSAGGEDPGMPLKLRVLGSLDSCEASALRVRALLSGEPVVTKVSAPGSLHPFKH